MQVKIISSLYILIFRPSEREGWTRSRKRNISFPQVSGFQPVFMAPEFTEGGIVARQQ